MKREVARLLVIATWVAVLLSMDAPTWAAFSAAMVIGYLVVPSRCP